MPLVRTLWRWWWRPWRWPGACRPAAETPADLADQLRAQLKAQPQTRGLVPVEPHVTCPTRGLVIAPCTDIGTGGQVSPVTVVPDTDYQPMPDALAINIRITFDFDSAALRPAETPKLDALCEAMNAVDVETFQVIGHTDTRRHRGLQPSAFAAQRPSRSRAGGRQLRHRRGPSGSHWRRRGIPYDKSNPRRMPTAGSNSRPFT